MMKQRVLVGLSMLLSVLLSGCFNTRLMAPENHPVSLLSAEKPAEFSKVYKNWYLLGGLLPIYTKQPDKIIAKENLAEVRVQTEDTISDGVITTATMFLFYLAIFPQTVVVEGNRQHKEIRGSEKSVELEQDI